MAAPERRWAKLRSAWRPASAITGETPAEIAVAEARIRIEKLV